MLPYSCRRRRSKLQIVYVGLIPNHAPQFSIICTFTFKLLEDTLFVIIVASDWGLNFESIPAKEGSSRA